LGRLGVQFGGAKSSAEIVNTISVIFSNGTDAMVSASFRNSLSSYAHFFKHIVTVEETRRYKPAPEVYEMLARKVRKAEKVGKM
jgi:2-haloacid dehalogenase